MWGVVAVAACNKSIKRFLGDLGIHRYQPMRLKDNEFFCEHTLNGMYVFDEDSSLNLFYVSNGNTAQFYLRGTDGKIVFVHYRSKPVLRWVENMNRWYEGYSVDAILCFENVDEMFTNCAAHEVGTSRFNSGTIPPALTRFCLDGEKEIRQAYQKTLESYRKIKEKAKKEENHQP